ncbi:MAG: cysteine hydrolase [Acidobacteriota bacterium]
MADAIGMLALLTGGVLVVCAGVLAGFFILLAGPTKGPKIQEYADPRKALLVIDIQEDFTGKTAKPPFPYKDSNELIESVNRAIEIATVKGFIIVYIRQEFEGFAGKMISRLFGRGTAVKGSPGAEMDQRIFIESDNIFSKPKGDAFSNIEFGKFLVEHQVNELFLTGLDAEFCVRMTARGALNRGYRVNAVTDCIALRAERKWDALMKKYERYGVVLKRSEEL